MNTQERLNEAVRDSMVEEPKTVPTIYDDVQYKIVATKSHDGRGTWYSRRKIQSTYQRPDRKIGRNEQCPCGSGFKFKQCCIDSV